MPAKKTVKKSKTKRKTTKKSTKQKIDGKWLATHGHFLGVLVLFCSFSLYAIFSFFTSTQNYLNSMKASVLGAEDFVVSDISEADTGTKEVVPGPDLSQQFFTDVPTDHMHAKAIGALYSAGLISGYENGSYKPDDYVNRAELLKVVTDAVDADFGGMSLENCFSDVEEEWFSTFICYSKSVGWVKGYDDNTFKPSQHVVRAEAIKIIFTAFEYPVCDQVSEAPYEDVAVDSWYAPYACQAKEDGIIAAAGKFRAGDKLTRAELAKVIYNVMLRKGLI